MRPVIDPILENPAASQPRRPGFTLVELLVVIAIISVLAALLIPAVWVSIRKAKTARIGLEMAAIQKALESYKNKTGEYPPDFSYNPAGGTPQDQILAEVNAHLGREFRRRIPTDFRPKINLLTGDPIAVTAGDVAKLDPTEALYFWLQGFSADPQAPLSGSGDRQPFFEFDKSRLVDRDNDGFPEYYPQGDSTQTPYVYYAARNTGSERTAYLHINIYLASSNLRGLPLPYFSTVMVPDPGGSGTSVNAAAAPNKFQLISAGLDGEYGSGDRVFTERISDNAEKDDMTNFSESKVLEDLVQ